MSNEDMEFCLKMSPCKCGSGSGEGAKLPDLSFEERDAGFKDEFGDNVYFKVVYLPDFPNGNTDMTKAFGKKYPHGIQNYKRMVNLIVRWGLPTGPTPMCNVGNRHAAWAESVVFAATTEEVWVHVSGSSWAGYCGYAILYYTCMDR